MSSCLSISDAVAWRPAAAHWRNRGTDTPCPPSMAGRIEDAHSGRILRGNVGLERRSRSGCIDGVEGGQWMSGSVAIHPAERPTVRLSGRCANRRNVETACGVDSQWSAYPWLVERPRRERRAVARHTWIPQEYRAEAHVACRKATCAFAAPRFLGSRAVVTGTASSTATASPPAGRDEMRRPLRLGK